MSLLPLPEARFVDPLDALSARCRRIANVVEGISRRRDVKTRRAKLMLLLLELQCPTGATPRKRWYIPGAVTRVGAVGIRRAWRHYWQEDPPTKRTIDRYLGALEQACVLVRAPGDWIPMRYNPEHPERRPRYANTFHILEDEAAAEWWAKTGWGMLERSPNARHSPDRWRMLFGSWRKMSATAANDLFGDLTSREPPPLPPTRTRLDRVAVTEEMRDDATGLEDLALREARPFEILSGLRDFGVRVTGGFSFQLARDVPRLKGALAVLVVAMRRGDRIRNRAAWLVRAWKNGSPRERGDALSTLTRARARRGKAHGKPRQQRFEF